MNANRGMTNQEKTLSFKVLCVFAFVFGGFTLVYSIFILLNGLGQPSVLDGFRIELFPEDLRLVSRQIVSALGFLLAVFTFFGIIQLWNKVKAGFWVFSISIFLFLLLPFIFLEVSFFWLFRTLLAYILITGLFIVLFRNNLKNMA
ncbi:MAG TPA: hypothetical protein VLH61_03080 [Bacteroidales bacterium]|nr:hypothetical protein [Bacteroidales bacterium]